MPLQFNAFVRALMAGGGAPPPAPAMVFASYGDLATSMGGFCTQPSAGRWNMLNEKVGNSPGTAFAWRIKGSSASMYAFSGDTTPFRVLVDSDVYANRTMPIMAGGKIPLFTGLADTYHDVMVWTDNSGTGQGFPATGNLVEAFGSAASVQPMGVMHRLTAPTSPCVQTAPSIVTAYYPTTERQIVQQTGYGNACGSVHFRASFDKLYIHAHKLATHAMVSIDGANPVLVTLSAWDDSVQGTAGWRLVNTPAAATVKSYIISCGPETGLAGAGSVIHSVLAYGTGAQILAPTGTRRHVAMMGASQVEGIVDGARSFKIDCHQVQNRVPIYATNIGSSGSTTTLLTTWVPTIAAALPNKDIAMLSVGINSADDANFQPDYQALIQACLTAGFTKVVARGIVMQAGSTAAKNAKIAAAVASFSSPNVVYADVSTWVATLDGAGGTIAMPDGAHPNGAGYAEMANLWARDHSALFT